MPGTGVEKSLCARKESSPGISMATLLWPLSTSPYAKTENGAGPSLSHSASAAAIFIGCCRNMTLPSWSPLIAVSAPAMTRVTRPSRSDVRITLTCFLRIRWYAAMPTMNAAPVRKAAVSVWKTTTSVVSWVSTFQKSVSSARPLAALYL